MLWAWDDKATPEVRIALADESWRVREMAFKVIARHLLGDFLDDAVAGRDDRVARVRQAAHRATVRLTSAEA